MNYKRAVALLLVVSLVVTQAGTAATVAHSSTAPQSEARTHASAFDGRTPADISPANRSGERDTTANESQSANTTVGELTADDLPSETDSGAVSSASMQATDVVVEATNASAVDVAELRAVAGDVGSRHGRRVEVTVSPSAVGEIRALPWVRSVTPVVGSSAAVVSEGVSSVDAPALHEAGVSGENVSVGVLTFGVRPDSPEYAEQVVATKSFHPEGLRTSDPKHGTGVTEVIADTAPNASLYLTSFYTSVDYANAVSWLQAQNVDVIVLSGHFYGQEGTGDGAVSQIAEQATESGVFWANAAGNSARKHWQGTYEDPDGDTWMNYGGTSEMNALNGGDPLPAGMTIGLRLKWQDFPRTNTDYTLYLLDANKQVIAESERGFAGSDYPYEVLTATLPHDGRYYFAIAGDDSPHTIEVFGSDNVSPFQYHVREGSVRAPAVARGVTAVGAYHVPHGQLARYSSAGPTNDGRRGVDVIGPSGVTTRAYDGRFYGTSAAAPHVGGAAALLTAINESASAADIESALLQSAEDVGPTGRDVYTGAGRVNVTAAAEIIDPSVPLTVSQNRSHVEVGDWVSYHVTRADTGDPVNARVTVGEDTATTGTDGSIAVRYGAAGVQTLTARPTTDPPTADFEPTNTSVTVEPAHVDLDLAVNRTTVLVGEPVRFTVTANATGDPQSNVRVLVGETPLRTDERGRVTHTFTEPGAVSVATAQEDTSSYRFENDTVTVRVWESAEPTVTDYRVDRTTVALGENVTVTATVQNPGEEPGEATVTLYVNGSEVETKTTSVAGRSATAVGVTTNFDATGTYSVAVDDLNATTVAVTPSNTAVRYDLDDDGFVNTTEVLTAIQDWANGEERASSTTDVLRLIELWAERIPVSQF